MCLIAISVMSINASIMIAPTNALYIEQPCPTHETKHIVESTKVKPTNAILKILFAIIVKL